MKHSNERGLHQFKENVVFKLNIKSITVQSFVESVLFLPRIAVSQNGRPLNKKQTPIVQKHQTFFNENWGNSSLTTACDRIHINHCHESGHPR